MCTHQLVLISILIIIIVLIAYYSSHNYNVKYLKAQVIDSPWSIYKKSNGAIDDAAMLALERIQAKPNPNASDHILAGTIITRNILTNGGSLQRNLRNDFINDVKTHYIGALEEIDRGNLYTLPRTTRIGNFVDPATDIIAPDFMLDRIMEFAHENVDGGIFNAADEQKMRIIDTRHEQAKNENNKASSVASYMEMAKTNTNDPQNSHDTGVLACSRNIIKRLREDQIGLNLPMPNDIIAEVIEKGAELSNGRPHRVHDVVQAIERTKNNERVIALDITDAECLGRVWLRASDIRNGNHKNDMHQSIFDALYDCWEDGLTNRSLVCVNGRVMRILSSLTLLDWDKSLWEIKKLEQYKNDIFELVRKTIQDVAREALKSNNSEMVAAGRSYLAESPDEIVEVDAKVMDELGDKMRYAIVANIDDYKKKIIKDAIPNYMMDNIKQEAMAAV